MSVDSVLDSALTTLLVKAQRALVEDAVRPANIAFTFAGGGSPLDATLTDPTLHEIPFPCRLVWAHIYALDTTGHPTAVDATVDLQLSQFSSPDASAPLYGGDAPSLSASGFENLDISNWLQNLTYGDVLTATLTAFVGTAVGVVLALQFRPTGATVGIDGYTDGGGGTYTDADGNDYDFRT